MPPTSRSRRTHEATSSIEDLYHRSAARDNSGSGLSKSVFRFKPIESARGSINDRPGALASPHFGGVPLNKDIIEGTVTARSSDGGRSTTFSGGRKIRILQQQGTVKTIPRAPIPRAGMPVSQEVNQPAVDSRGLGVKLEGAPGSFLMTNVRREGPSPEVTSGFQQRSPPKGQNSSQQSSPRDESASYTSIHRSQKPGQTPQTSFQVRNPKGEGRSTRSDRNRVDRSELRRQKRGSGWSNRGGPEREVRTEEEHQYLKETAELKSQKPVQYEPVEFSKETFSGMGPATVSDEWGMSEMLGERVRLAENFIDREFIQWDSKEQKADVMAVVAKLKAVREGRKPNGNDQEAKEASPTSRNGHQQAQALMQKLFAGEYAKFKRLREDDVLGHVERHVHRNDSFYPEDEKSLLEKARSILPAEQALKVGREARKEVKA